MKRHLHAFIHLPFYHIAHEPCGCPHNLGLVLRDLEPEVLNEVGNHSLHLDNPVDEKFSLTQRTRDDDTHANRQL